MDLTPKLLCNYYVSGFIFAPDTPYTSLTLAKEISFYWQYGRLQLYFILMNRYSWIADQRDAHKKSICQRTKRVTTLSRPPLESSRREEFRSARYIFVTFIFDLLIFETSENMPPTKINQADLGLPRRTV